MQVEEFRPIPEYAGSYEISNLGNVRNCKTGRILNPFIHFNGYGRTSITKNKITRKFYTHHLVYQVFVGDFDIRDRTKKIIHKNGIKTDNRAENLELVYNDDYRYNNSYDIPAEVDRNFTMRHLSFDKQNQAWAVLFKNKRLGIYKHLGYYKDLEEAKQLRDLFKDGLYHNIKPEGEYPGLLYLPSESVWHVNVFDQENRIYHIAKFDNEREAKIEWLLYTDLLNRKH